MRTAPDQQPYLLILLGDPDMVADLGPAVAKRASDLIGRNAIELSDDLPEQEADPALPAPHAIVVAVIAPDIQLPAGATDTIARALEGGIGVLPVLAPGASAQDLPQELSPINAMSWEDDGDKVQLAILRLLGLAPAERKVFISYRRQDASALADQLRRGLTDRGYDVFLDRFSVEPADDFQARLNLELGDKAFVLLLESRRTQDSEWVRHEISYALTHGIPVLAVTLPDTPAKRRFDSVPDDLRLQLRHAKLGGAHLMRERELEQTALESVLWRVEWEHARQLRRHRQQLLETLTDWLRTSGSKVAWMPDWSIVATGGPGEGVYLVTARAPTPGDLRAVDLVRRRADVSVKALVAHNPELLDDALIELTDWIVDGRNMGIAIHGGLRQALHT